VPELDLPDCVSLVDGELVEARGLTIVLRHTTGKLVADSQTDLRVSVSVVGSEPEKARGLLLAHPAIFQVGDQLVEARARGAIVLAVQLVHGLVASVRRSRPNFRPLSL
jgi:hypothetical protein